MAFYRIRVELGAKGAVIRATVRYVQIKGISYLIGDLRLIFFFFDEAEKGFRVKSGYPRNVSDTQALHLGHLLRGLDHERRLAPLSPVRNRREIRAISLDHEPLNRNNLQYLSYCIGLGEGNDAGKGEIETEFKKFFGGFSSA